MYRKTKNDIFVGDITSIVDQKCVNFRLNVLESEQLDSLKFGDLKYVETTISRD